MGPEELPDASEKGPASFKGRLNLSDFIFIPAPKQEHSLSTLPHTTKRKSVDQSSIFPARSLVLKAEPVSHLAPSKCQGLTSPSPLAPPLKRSRTMPPRAYAPPSTYEHLSPLPDTLATGLICIFIGLNPGILSATTAHAYAHPSNLFWKLLHSSGCTPRRCHPSEDVDLPRLFALGNTNIVSRPTRNSSELTRQEMDDSVAVLEEKVRSCRPEAVCVVGKGIWESLWRMRHGRRILREEFRYGWQDEGERIGSVQGDEGWEGARVFVACSTSGLAATLSPVEKQKIWRELGAWVEERRRIRARDVKKEDKILERQHHE